MYACCATDRLPFTMAMLLLQNIAAFKVATIALFHRAIWLFLQAALAAVWEINSKHFALLANLL